MALRQDRTIWRAMVLAVVFAASLGVASAEESALLAPGVSAYQAGKTDQAIKALSAVLTNSGASGTDHARAYYYRGLAYEKSGKPAQAIADLNNALWLKGLSDGERANALLARGKAYKVTGLEARAAQDFRDAERLAPGAASAELAAVAPAETEAPAGAIELQNNNGGEAGATAPQSSGSTALVLSPSTVQTAAKPKKNSEAISTATVGGETTASQSAEASSALRERGGTVSRTSSSEALSTATVPSNNGSLSSIFSGDGDFFSNLFSSSPSAETTVTESTSAAPAAETPQRQVMRARGETVEIGSSGGSTETVVATAAPATAAAEAPLVLAPATAEAQSPDTSFTAETTAAEPQLSSWSSTTETEEQQASFKATTEPAAPAASNSSDAGSSSGTTVASFFESLFSGNEPTDTTGSATAAPPQPEVQVASLEPQVPATVEPVAEAPTGRYRAQIATVRTPEEAQIIARRMETERKALLGNRQANVEPVVLGNMGTFYAVMIGPFADERQSEKFCGKLQNEGIDCFVAEP